MTISIEIRLGNRRDRYGRYSLRLQIESGHRRGILESPYRLYADQLDSRRGVILPASSGPHDEFVARQANEWVQRHTDRLWRMVAEAQGGGNGPDLGSILRRIRDEESSPDFGAFLDQEIERQERQEHFGTASSYRSTVTAYRRFVSGAASLPGSIPLRCTAFGEYLHDKGLSGNTIDYYLRTLRSLYNKYRRHYPSSEVLSDPFPDLARLTSPTRKLALSASMLRRVVQAELLPGTPLYLSRDLFLFSLYSRGMSFVDMAYLTDENLFGDTLRYRRHKTGQFFTVDLSLPLRSILGRYSDPSSRYLLPILPRGASASALDSKELYRHYKRQLARHLGSLKRLSRRLDLPAPLSFNVARHSWATIARDCGVSLPVISAGLGHTSERTTRIYLKDLDPIEVHRANELVRMQLEGIGC